MSPQWMPQNIQKRLLLYVLHQLSLFSEIDLPNLEEVSFNNILLRDVLIDSEKVGKLPGCSLRFGKIGTLILNGGVMGGVNIDANNVELVIAPDFDINEDIKSNLNFSIAQSTADLANSIMVDQGKEPSSLGEGLKSKSSSSSLNSDESNTSKYSRPSALSGVMAKAVDMALSRLQVTLSSVKIKLISELTDLSLEVDKISISTVNGSRKINIQGVRLICLKPDVNPGDYEEDLSDYNVNDNVENTSDSDNMDDDQEGDVYVDESLMNSMVFTHEEASSIYMSAIDESFAGPNPKKNNKTRKPILFAIDFIDISFDGLSSISNLDIDVGNINVSFTPLVPTIMILFNGILRSIKLQTYQRRKKNINRTTNRNHNFPQYAKDDIVNDVVDEDMIENTTSSDFIFLKKFHISNIVLSLNSGINEQGTFTSSNNHLFFELRNLYIKSKNDELVYGGVEGFNILRNINGITEVIFCFDEKNPEEQQDEPQNEKNITKADIRFEVRNSGIDQSKTVNITTLLSKPAKLNLDIDSLVKLVDLFTAFEDIHSKYNSLKISLDALAPQQVIKSSQTAETTKNSFLLQTSLININLEVSQSLTLNTIVFPLSYNSMKNDMSTLKILIKTKIGGAENLIATIQNLNLYFDTKEFRSFIDQNSTSNNNGRNSLPRKITLNSNVNLMINKINITISYKALHYLLDELSGFFSELSKKNMLKSYSRNYFDDKKLDLTTSLHNSIYSKKPNRRLGSTYNNISILNSTRYNNVSFRISLKKIEVNISEFKPDFGDINIRLHEIMIHEYKNDIQGFAMFLDVKRIINNAVADDVVIDFRREGLNNINSPFVLFLLKQHDKGNTIDFILRNFIFEYYTSWLKIFENDSSTKKATEYSYKKSNENKSISESKNLHIRFVFHDCCIGLTPGRLRSKGILVISKGNSDITFGKYQYYIKSSFRKSSLLLIDDLENLKVQDSVREQNLNSLVTPVSYFLSIGYISVLSINSTHVGVTVNTDIEKILERNKELKIQSDISYFDIKLNSDQHQLDLCADSMVTLIQLITDLKLPLNFEDKDRMKVSLEESLDLSDILSDNDVTKRKPSMDNSTKDTLGDQDSLHIVDEYYTNQASCDDLGHGMKYLSIINENNDTDPTILNTESLAFDDEHFTNEFSEFKVGKINPMNININISKVNIYLYDGFEWKHTRKSIKNAFKKMEGQITTEKNKKTEQDKLQNKNLSNDIENEDEVITETIFKSIHISLPKGIDPSNVAKNINKQVQGNYEDIHNAERGKNYRSLRLRRSNSHRIMFELTNTEINVLILSTRDPRKDETDKSLYYEVVNTLEIIVDDFEAYDNVPTSTWNKFLTYMRSSGDREIGKSILKLSIINSRPEPSLVAADSIIKVSILPLRLYIDQETLDFIVRFVEFRDERFDLPPDEIIFIQKFDIDSLHLKIDYKPKNINFSGLRSGNASELMNLFTLDGSEIKLPKATVYGLLGFPKIGEELAKVWLPHIQKTQLGGILSGLSPIRSLVNIGGGFKDLIVIPVKEYKKDGRLVRSIQKGTSVFAKTTISELLKFGVKLASGTQVLLEQGEELLGGEGLSIRKQESDLASRDVPKHFTNNELMTTVNTEEQNNLKKSNNDYLASSILLTENDRNGMSHFSNNQLYSYIDLDDSNDIDGSILNSKLLLLKEDDDIEFDDEIQNLSDSDIEFDSDDLNEGKLVSLYSNQPESIQEGLKLAYTSINKNLGVTKKKILNLKNEISETETFQESLTSVIKSGPVIIIRPIIGTTEAISKTLMGIGNGIDSKYLNESKDKYRSKSKKN